MNLTIEQLIDALCDPLATANLTATPDGVVDLSYIITPLLAITKDGRALASDTPNAIGAMIGNLLRRTIPDNHTDTDLVNTIATLTVFTARILRAVATQCPDWSIEEFLVDPFNQDDIRALATEFTAISYTSHPELARHPVFHTPVEITDTAKEGFAQRRIYPYDEIELDFDFTITIEDSTDNPTATPLLTPVDHLPDNIDHEDLTADSLNGFDEFFDYGYDQE